VQLAATTDIAAACLPAHNRLNKVPTKGGTPPHKRVKDRQKKERRERERERFESEGGERVQEFGGEIEVCANHLRGRERGERETAIEGTQMEKKRV